MDKEIRALSGRALAFELKFIFQYNHDIELVLKNSFEKILNDFETFSPIINLADRAAKKALGTTIDLEDKRKFIVKLDLNLLKEAIKYIRSYYFIEKIVA